MKARRKMVWRFSIRSALFVMTVGAAPCAWGAFVDGNDLVERCKNTGPGELAEHGGRLAACVGYLVGVVDSEVQLANWRKEKSLLCLPSGTAPEQLRQVFLNDVTTHPQDWHSVAAGLVLNAFIKAWPCSE